MSNQQIIDTARWEWPPEHPVLGSEDVHVWCTRLDRGRSEALGVSDLWGVLSTDERERAQRFRLDLHRDRFVVGRGILRTILGGYLRRDPQHLRFRYGEHGKPEVAGESGEPAITFNLSHVNDVALFAMALGRRVGIDVDCVRPGVSMEAISQRFFSPGELNALDALPEAQREEGYLRCWTRKESYVKALGEGLSIPTDQFEVSLEQEVQPRLRSVAWDRSEPMRWRIVDLDVGLGAGYEAALCVEGSDWRLRLVA